MLLALPPELFGTILYKLCVDGDAEDAKDYTVPNPSRAALLNLYMSAKACRGVIDEHSAAEDPRLVFDEAKVEADRRLLPFRVSLSHALVDERIMTAFRALRFAVVDERPRRLFFPCPDCRGNVGPSLLEEVTEDVLESGADHVHRYVDGGLRWMRQASGEVACRECANFDAAHRRVALPEGPEYDRAWRL